jgi:acyl-CoA thioesterase-1
MRQRLAAYLIPVLFFVCHETWSDNAANTILVVGDSLSAGYGVDPQETWVSLLSDRLAEKGYGYRVVNASISGDTTNGGLKRLPRALELHQPSLVIIGLGGNDGLRGLPVKGMRENLAQMIELSRTAGAKVVLLGILIPPNYGRAYEEAFAGVYPTLAEEYGVPLVPFFMEGVALNAEMMQADGIHPNSAAQPRLLDNVWPALSGNLESG